MVWQTSWQNFPLPQAGNNAGLRTSTYKIRPVVYPQAPDLSTLNGVDFLIKKIIFMHINQ
jgi:hypothetical protein